jgi:glyoxylase-like metal-dependent hydrolase (beta-lactamase superfamily II)
LAGNNSSTRPDLDEIELSLFGPGFGESIVLHLGADFWVVIDSCLTSGNEPSALQYLRSINVDPSDAIKLVIATHWHDDHMAGIGEVFRVSTNAKFVCSAALRGAEFRQLIASSRRLMVDDTGVAELASIMETLQNPRETGFDRSRVYINGPSDLEQFTRYTF